MPVAAWHYFTCRGFGWCAKRGQAAVPHALTAATVKAANYALLTQAVAAGVISARVAALTEGVLTTMFFSKLKAGFVCVLALAVVATGLGQAFYNASGQTTGVGEAGAADAPKVAQTVVPSSKAAKDTQAKLQATGDFKFDKLSLREALNTIRSQYGINIVVSPDERNPDQGEPQPVEDFVAVSLELKHVPLETALRYLLKPVNLAFINQDGILVIRSREKAMSRKVYSVGALLGKDEEKNAQALIQVIIRSIDPESWSWVGSVKLATPAPVGTGVGSPNGLGQGIGVFGVPGGGPVPPIPPGGVNEETGTSYGGYGASITYFPGTKALVVRQSPEAHREIEDLLHKLAEK